MNKFDLFDMRTITSTILSNNNELNLENTLNLKNLDASELNLCRTSILVYFMVLMKRLLDLMKR